MLNDYSLSLRVRAVVEHATSAVYCDGLLNKLWLLWMLALQWSFILFILCVYVCFF